MLGLNISGMTCGCCSGRVKQVLEARPDVRAVHIDYRLGRGLVDVVEGGDTNAILQAVNATGFSCTT